MSTSLFDLLQPSEDPGGLSGLALALQGQGGQPRGIKQGLGAGLLNLSNVAQESLPTAIQGGFGSGALAGFLGSIGGPARQAVSQEEEKGKARREVQLAFLKDAFPKLSSGSKQVVLEKLGIDLGGLQFQEEKADPSYATKQLIDLYAKIAGDSNQSKETRDGAFEGLIAFAPEAADAFKGLKFFDDSPDSVKATANDLFDNFTTNSVKAFLDPTDTEHHGIFSKLVERPPEEKKGATGKIDKLAAQAVSDRGQIEALAQQRGITIDAATDIFFQGDKARRASYEKEWGLTAGAAPASEEDNIKQWADMLAKAGVLKNAQQMIPAAVAAINQSREQAKVLAEQNGTIALSGQKAGARNPAGIAAPLPAGTAPFAAPPTTLGASPFGAPAAAAAPPPAQAAPAFPGPVAPPPVAPALTPQAVPVPPSYTESVKEQAKGQSPDFAAKAQILYQTAVAAGVDLTGVTNYTTLIAKLKTLSPEQKAAIQAAAKSRAPGGGLGN